MSRAIRTPVPVNEPVFSYAPGSPEKQELKARLAELSSDEVDIPVIIGGKEIRTGSTQEIRAPHDHGLKLGQWHRAGRGEIEKAIENTVEAQRDWAALPWQDRAAVFLRAAELLSTTWRQSLNAATMLGQSKNPFQAEIDSACELIDFYRFNVHFAEGIFEQQPESDVGVWNRTDYRPLEGFVYAVSPFNFTAIGGNLTGSPALVGNGVIWKPSDSAVYSAYLTYRLLEEAGLPPGVINFVPGDPVEVTDVALAHRDFAGLHFTGSTQVFRSLWGKVGENMDRYRAYPRIVGETGGKDFIVAHPSANVDALRTAIVRGAFEYQGQKCSAASRAYIPESVWKRLEGPLVEETESLVMGDPKDFRNIINAVIHERSFKKITGYLERAREAAGVDILAGGTADDGEGYFVRPTILRSDSPGYETMCEEIFGPVMTVHVYPDREWSQVLDLVDRTSPYALTGAVFARDRMAVREAIERLRFSAGNFYVNDKPTGAVVGQQPFGGARASGTNDKAGSPLNLLRWLSPRSLKETLVPPTDYRYPFMDEA